MKKPFIQRLRSAWACLIGVESGAAFAAEPVLSGTAALDVEVALHLQHAVTLSDEATMRMLGRASELRERSSSLVAYLAHAQNQSEAMQAGIEMNTAIIAELAAFVESLPRQIAEERQQFQCVVGEVKRLGEMTEAIRAMARQTEILAINAAIEAARAGEAGRGFAVLAGEVRRLATQSNESASRIEEDIQRLVRTVDGSYNTEFQARSARTESESERLAGLTRQLDDSYIDMRAFYQMLMHAVTRHNSQLDEGIAGLLDAGQYHDIFKQMIERTQPALASRHAVLRELVEALLDGGPAEGLAERACALVDEYLESEARHRNPVSDGTCGAEADKSGALPMVEFF